jgi:hypothetical protein
MCAHTHTPIKYLNCIRTFPYGSLEDFTCTKYIKFKHIPTLHVCTTMSIAYALSDGTLFQKISNFLVLKH